MDLLPNYYRKEREADRLISEKDILVSRCSICNGSGLITKKKIEFKNKTLLEVENSINSNRRKCSCIKKYNWIEKLLISGIRKEFWDCEEWDLYDNLLNKDNWKYINFYVKNLPLVRMKGIGFIFHGLQGTGKTSAGMLILLKALRMRYNVHYIYMRDLLSEIRTLTLSDKAYDIAKVKGFIDEICDVDFLFIDEVGKAKTSEFTKNEFEGFIRKRVANGLPTILATNLPKSKILEVYGESLDDLLWGSMKELNWVGKSYRKNTKTKIIDNFFKRR